MRRIKRVSFKTGFMLTIIILFSAAASFAQAPNTIMYQGRLTNSDGAPLQQADVDSVRFTIYSEASANLYDTCVTDLIVDMNGVFTVELGPLAASVFSGEKRLLGIKVNADSEMRDRQPITSAPYSINTAAPTPIAYATIRGSDGYVYSGTPNVSCVWDNASSRYAVSISGINYVYTNYTTVVTCSGGAYLYRTGSVGGDLLIYFYNTSMTLVQNSYQFQFVTYASPSGKDSEMNNNIEESENADESTLVE